MDAYIEKHLINCEERNADVGDLISFEYFLKVYHTAIVWNRVKFEKQKKDLIAKRRQAMKNKDMTKYRQVCMDIGTQDEQCLQDVLEEILEKLEISEEQFKQALNLYMVDETKQAQIKAALEDANEDKQEGVRPNDRKESKPTMTRKEAIAG